MDWLHEWVERWSDLITLASALTLLALTAWYAKTTKDMATTANEAAKESARATFAAEKAADAARDAATVAQSQITVEFAGRLVSVAPKGERARTPCIQLKSYGDSVVIQSVRSRRAFRDLDDHGARGPAELVGEEFVSYDDENSLPRRLHRGELLSLTHPGLDDGGAPFGRFIVSIDYTFSEAGATGGTKELSFDAVNSKW